MASSSRHARSSGAPRGGFSLSSHRTQNFLAAGVVILLCTLVVSLAAPLAWDSLIAQRSIDTINALKAGEDVSTELLIATLDAIGPVDLDHMPRGDRLINQGILSLAIAMRHREGTPERIRYLSDAKALAEYRLARAPADTHAWARLATAEYFLNGPSTLTFEALRMSHTTGPYEFYALRTRFELGRILWPLMDEELQESTIAQAVMLWNMRRERRRIASAYLDMPPDMQRKLAEAMSVTESGETFPAAVEAEQRRRAQAS